VLAILVTADSQISASVSNVCPSIFPCCLGRNLPRLAVGRHEYKISEFRFGANRCALRNRCAVARDARCSCVYGNSMLMDQTRCVSRHPKESLDIIWLNAIDATSAVGLETVTSGAASAVSKKSSFFRLSLFSNTYQFCRLVTRMLSSQLHKRRHGLQSPKARHSWSWMKKTRWSISELLCCPPFQQALNSFSVLDKVQKQISQSPLHQVEHL
jgi:hypothetical protein